MNNYNFGNVDIEFKTNKIFLLMKMLYYLEILEQKINTENSKLPHLSKSIEDFKKVVLANSKGLEDFNTFKDNAENKNMWAEYSEYITSFSQTTMEDLQTTTPELATAIQKLLNTDFFREVEQMNVIYSNEMQKRYRGVAEDIIGSTNVKKIIYMPFTPELFSIEPCFLSDKNNNQEFAVQFSIPTNKQEFQKKFGMEYTEGIESVILFHEKMHADIPPKSIKDFANPIKRELDSHLKHSIIELLSNGEMGISIAHHSNCFQSVFHNGKISYNGSTLKTSDLQALGVINNKLLNTEANEINKNNVEHYSTEDIGIIKIRGMIYPYALMYKNRNSENPLKEVEQEIQRDKQMLQKIYGKEFVEQIMCADFLKDVQNTVKPYNNILEFAEGMSKELLGIEQVKSFETIPLSVIKERYTRHRIT